MIATETAAGVAAVLHEAVRSGQVARTYTALERWVIGRYPDLNPTIRRDAVSSVAWSNASQPRAAAPVVSVPDPASASPAVPFIDDVQQPEVEDFHAFMRRMAKYPPLGWHISGLIPEEGICLWHGQPRDFKSFCALETALALTTGRPAFNLARFAVTRRVRVVYFTEEDSERLFWRRLRWLTAMDAAPDARWFFPVVRQGVTFDREDTRQAILSIIQASRADVAVFDPLRSFTACVDKGPAEFQPVAQFLRQIQNETAAKTILAVHHDKKPTAGLSVDRPRSQEASGGGVFSVADCPVGFTKLAWNRTAVFPEDYKLSGDPSAFEVEFQTDEGGETEHGPQFGSWVRAVAVSKRAHVIAASADDERLFAFLRAGGWHATADIAKGAKLRDTYASHRLRALHDAGQVQMVTGEAAAALGRSPKAKLWALLP